MEEESKNGEGIPVTFIVKDVAGNKTIVTDKSILTGMFRRQLYKECRYMITSKPVKVN